MDLHIYIAGHCPVSVYAMELADDVQHAFPHVRVCVVDVEGPAQGTVQKPAGDLLFTPGYFLDGVPIHWGNPTREKLFHVLRQKTHESGQGEKP